MLSEFSSFLEGVNYSFLELFEFSSFFGGVSIVFLNFLNFLKGYL
jgi:hypothetical protein